MSTRLVAAIVDFLHEQDLLSREEVRAALEREIEAAGTAAVAALRARLQADAGWTYHPPDPLARRIHHLLADRFLDSDSGAHGIEHVAAAVRGPLVLVANHLSYADANVLEILLGRCRASAVAERLTAVAGPKVFTSAQRRFSSLCFGTIKVPQSADVASGEAALSAREVAAGARQAIDSAHARLAAGDVLLLFPEGTRSRTAAMQPMLPGAARYLDLPGTTVVPIGIAGSECLFPVGVDTVRRARVTVRVGPPLAASALREAVDGDRRALMDALGLAVARLVPDHYRGLYAMPERFPKAASALQVR